MHIEGGDDCGMKVAAWGQGYVGCFCQRNEYWMHQVDSEYSEVAL